MDLANLVASGKGMAESRNILDSAGTKTSGTDKKAKESKKDSKSEKSGSTKKSTSKGKGSPGKKGGKKKKAKEKDIDLDWAIPEGVTRGLNLFLPDRRTMQRLVMRASNLKPDEDEPYCEEVRPWVRIQNIDVHV